APLILGFILGPLLEENMRRSLLLSQGDAMIFLQRPISAAFLLISVILCSLLLLTSARKHRAEAFQE
ncbi:MAG: tripartite tricarboxylate transporter permease, partial [Hyphomicrobiales bacterium]|nr:tripartite tricarboxylate transporter permease [Hyphomicrobiales bacterium]